MNPRIRFAVTMSFIVFAVWFYGIANDYLFAETGLNVGLFFNGILRVGFASFCGFAFVWICVYFVTKRKQHKNAFEEDTEDEYGTTFNWPIMLSKFVPEIIAPPVNAPISELEQELIGFLNGYRDWPQELDNKNQGSLAETAMHRWHAVRQLQGTTELHRVVALCLDIGKVLSYTEKRQSAPLIKFWKRDKIKFVRKAAEHGGFSAFILSTFETFRKMDEETRRILLVSIRYGREPGRIPTNSPKMVNDILNAVQRAEAKLVAAGNVVGMSEEDALKAFTTEVNTYLKGVLTQLPLHNDDADNGQGIYLGGKKAILIVQRSALLRALSHTLPAATREVLGLWENDTVQPEVDMTLINAARNMGLLVEEWEGEAADNGTFTFSYTGQAWPRCLIFSATPDKTPLLFKRLNMLPAAEHIPEPAVDDATLLADIQAKALSIDTKLQGS